MIVWGLKVQLIEKDLGHLIIVVLTSVDQDLNYGRIAMHFVVVGHCPKYWGNFDKLRSAADNVNELHNLLV
jgi:hypothetical protein